MDRVILECFISEGEYVVLNDCCLKNLGIDFHQNEMISIKFNLIKFDFFKWLESTKFYMEFFRKKRNRKQNSILVIYEDKGDWRLSDFINNLLPNLRKLSPDELMIKDIIT